MSRIRDIANALSSTSSLIAQDAEIPAHVAGKNKIINGDFSIWQRGSTFSSPADLSYNADRFSTTWNGTGATRSISRQTFTPGTCPSGYESQYFVRYEVSNAGSGNNYNYIYTPIEDVRTLAGQTVTFSFWAKASAATSIAVVQIDQIFGSGGSTTNYNALSSGAQGLSLTTSWQRFSVTSTLASVSGKTIGPGSWLRVFLALPAGSQTFQIDTWGWQLEAGSVATPFTLSTGNQILELAACQRYYVRLGGDTAYGAIGVGNSASSTEANYVVTFPVPMRVAPTSVEFSTIRATDFISINSPITALAIAGNETTKYCARLYTGATTGLTAHRPNFISNYNSANGYVAFSAELI